MTTFNQRYKKNFKPGWFKESYRHMLASKGVKTSKIHRKNLLEDILIDVDRRNYRASKFNIEDRKKVEQAEQMIWAGEQIEKMRESGLVPETIPQRKLIDPEDRKKYQKEYHQEYRQRPGVKERMREYYRRPDVKERKREYRQRPDVKERKQEYWKVYRDRPGVKERKSEYMKLPEAKEQAKIRRLKRLESLADVTEDNIKNIKRKLVDDELQSKV